MGNEVAVVRGLCLLHDDSVGVINALRAEAEDVHVASVLGDLNDVVDFLFD